MFVRILFFTLFPYTTLFRSRDVARGHRPAHREGPGTDGDAPGARLPSAVHGRRVLPHARAVAVHRPAATCDLTGLHRADRRGDRTSGRRARAEIGRASRRERV